MRKVKNIAVVALIGIGGIYLVSIGNAKPLAPVLKVGVLVSDSGKLGFVGQVQRAAVRLAVRDLSDRPIKVSIGYFDVGDSDQDRARALSKLKAFESDVIIAPVESESTKALVESTANSLVPMIAPSSLEDELGEETAKPWLFRLATSPSQDSFALVRFVSKPEPKQVVIVSGSLPQSRAQMRSLSFGLVMKGIRVQTLAIKDAKAIARTKPDALVLLSMEESLPFLSSMENWAESVPRVYLVPSNLADYSAYPFAKALKGVEAINPRTEVEPQFKAGLSQLLGNVGLQGPRAATILGLGQRAYDAVKIAVEARLRAKSDSPESLRSAISRTQIEGKALFERSGFLEQSEYSVFRYSGSGTFSQVSVFSPN
jgi:ABC-type branched-subunit amino acid transport system substrate-binding protein